ncbi:cation exchanger 3 [Actinidia rufa]|uniref:Cation exchanger 3 n=1 Tax=Actinidia rufa TaxID=165716 RepID=A0A7J0EBD2_9ERIC|nr:cation exchanger 3 [Actinidia rufa]
MATTEPWLMENGNLKGMSKETRHSRTVHNMSSSSLRKKSDMTLVSKVPCGIVRKVLANLQEVILGTKLSVLFPAIPLAIVAQCYGFALDFRSELTWTHPVGGTCQLPDRKQADVNSLLLLMGLLCHMLPLMFRYVGKLDAAAIEKQTLELSRVCSIVMLIAYFAYLVFQLWTHREFFEAQQEDKDDDVTTEEAPVVGFWSGFSWLLLMTVVIALLSEYVVATIEDISLGVALGSATQIAMFVVPLSVITAWIIGINMDLNFNLLETGSLALSILVTAFTLQDGTSHYMKGFVLFLCYIIIGACFFVSQTPLNQANDVNLTVESSTGAIFKA